MGMIYLVIALREEAGPLIRHFHLSKAEGSLPVFSNDEITLILSGSTPLNAASHTAAELSRHEIKPTDFLINIGTCAGGSHRAKGTILLINRISDFASGRDYYPDILASSLKEETRLITGSRIHTAEHPVLSERLADTVYDMEGSAVFHAASLFLAPHQLRFLKIVSDDGTNLPSPEEIRLLAESSLPVLEREIEAMKLQCGESELKEMDTDPVAELFCSSLTMKRQIRQLLQYCERMGIDWQKTIEQYKAEALLPALTKEKGKKLLQEVTDELLA